MKSFFSLVASVILAIAPAIVLAEPPPVPPSPPGLQPQNNLSDVASAATSRTNLGLGTAAVANTGTSGATIPLNNGNNTSSGNQTHTGTENFTGPFEIGGTAVTLPVPVAIGGTASTNVSDALQTVSGVLNASACGKAQTPSWCSGSDIGAWVNAAVAQTVAQGWTRPKIILDPTSVYAQTTTIVIPLNVIFDGQGAKITRAATSGASIVIGTAGGSCNFCWFNVGGVSNLVLGGPGYSTGHTDIGVYMGGDPAGILSPSTNYAGDAILSHVEITGFKTGYTYGNNTWQIAIKDSTINQNYDGILTPGSATNTGELMKVFNTNISNNSHCGFDLVGQQDEWAMYGGALDYNGSSQVCGTTGWLDLFSVHMENYTGPFVNMSGASILRMHGGSIVAVQNTGSENGLINWTATDITHKNLSLDSVLVSTAHSVPYVVYTGGLASDDICTNNVYFAYSPYIPAITDAGTKWCQAGNLTPASLSVGADEQRTAPPVNGILNEGTFYELGSIGVGTASPSALLHIRQNTASTDVAAFVQNDDTGNAAYWRAIANSYYVNSQYYGNGSASNWVAGEIGSSSYQIEDATNSLFPFTIAPGSLSDSIHITSTGVGIFKSSPSVALDVVGTGHFSGTVQGATINVSATTVPANGMYLPNTNTLGFSSNTTAAGTIDSTQHARLGGTGSPTIGSNACGSTTQGTIGAGSTDRSGLVTVGTASVTSCVVSFASTWGTAPRAVILTPANAAAAATGTTLAYVSAVGTTSFTITGTALAGGAYYYFAE